MKKIILIVLAVLCAARIVYLNLTFEREPVEIYQTGETVEYEEDYYYSNFYEVNNSNGYSVEVHSAELKSYAEYLEEHGFTHDQVAKTSSYVYGATPEYICEVELTFTASEEIWVSPYGDGSAAGISLVDTVLLSENGTNMQVYPPLLQLVHPTIDAFGFSLLPKSSMTVKLPYASTPLWNTKGKQAAYNSIKNDKFYLLVSMYPTRKMIDLNITEGA